MTPPERTLTPTEVCGLLAAWARVSGVESEACGKGHLVTVKSDLLFRLVFGGERGPSQTPCPVHKGHWSGIHWGWPGSVQTTVIDGERVTTPAEVHPRLQADHDAGCRCYTHMGSSATTGWQPDVFCCGDQP